MRQLHRRFTGHDYLDRSILQTALTVSPKTSKKDAELKEVTVMTNYKAMYSVLSAAMSDALDSLKQTQWTSEAIDIMSAALSKAEEIYIESSEDELT